MSITSVVVNKDEDDRLVKADEKRSRTEYTPVAELLPSWGVPSALFAI